LIIPEAGAEAVALGERLRLAIAETPMVTTAGPVGMTVSVGVANLAAGDGDLSSLLADADRALYRAKEAGRNRIATAEPFAPASDDHS
jgi:eukaryotic-like serine/threonine-protein kinase